MWGSISLRASTVCRDMLSGRVEGGFFVFSSSFVMANRCFFDFLSAATAMGSEWMLVGPWRWRLLALVSEYTA